MQNIQLLNNVWVDSEDFLGYGRYVFFYNWYMSARKFRRCLTYIYFQMYFIWPIGWVLIAQT
jgi:hypothetical protein